MHVEMYLTVFTISRVSWAAKKKERVREKEVLKEKIFATPIFFSDSKEFENVVGILNLQEKESIKSTNEILKPSPNKKKVKNSIRRNPYIWQHCSKIDTPLLKTEYIYYGNSRVCIIRAEST